MKKDETRIAKKRRVKRIVGTDRAMSGSAIKFETVKRGINTIAV